MIRDQQGIPHIFAQNDDDLFFAQGYVMAQDRLWQLELWRRWREGRLAEVFGPKAFDYDARARLMMFRGPWDAKEWTSYHPDAERLFTAWANGHNAYIATHADNLPVEFKLTGVKPEPWTAKTVTLRWAELGMDSTSAAPAAEIQLALNVKQFGAEEANRRAAPDSYDDLKVPEGLDLNWITEEALAAARKGDDDPFAPGKAGVYEVDMHAEEAHLANLNKTSSSDIWVPMKSIREEIKVKGEDKPRVVDLKFSKHGPVFYEDQHDTWAFTVRVLGPEPGTAPFKGSFKLAQATSCEDFFDRAMAWKLPSHNLICGDKKGNIALQVSGLRPTATDGPDGCPSPGPGSTSGRGFGRPAARVQPGARLHRDRQQQHPPAGLQGAAGLLQHHEGCRYRPHHANPPAARQADCRAQAVHDRGHGAYPAGQLLATCRARRAALQGMDGQGSRRRESTRHDRGVGSDPHEEYDAGAIYVRWTTTDAGRKAVAAQAGPEQRALVEQGLLEALERVTKDWGSDRSQWRYGRINQSPLQHMFIDEFSLKPVERPGGFNDVNATGANFRRIIDFSDVDKTMATNAPGESAQPGSPYYGNTREKLADGVYFNLPFTRPAVEKQAAHKLTLSPQ